MSLINILKSSVFSTPLTHQWSSLLSTDQQALFDLCFTINRFTHQSFLYQLLPLCWSFDPHTTLKLIFYLRDYRGQGERKPFYFALTWLSQFHPTTFLQIVPLVPSYGYYKDLFIFFGTAFENEILDLLVTQLQKDKEALSSGQNISLVAKWLPTEGSFYDRKYRLVSKICKKLKISKSTYRKDYLTSLRASLPLIERHLSSKSYHLINPATVPIIALHRYSKNLIQHGIKFSPQLYFTKPEQMFHFYLTKNMYQPLIELLWRNYLSTNRFSPNLFVVLDTSDSMKYHKFFPLKRSLLLLFSFGSLWSPLSLRPNFSPITGNSLFDQINNILNSRTRSTGNIDLTIYLLDLLESEQIPETLLFLSDLTFNFATSLTDFSLFPSIFDRYRQKALQPPSIIFWTLTKKYMSVSLLYNIIILEGYNPLIYSLILKRLKTPIDTKTFLSDLYTDIVNHSRYDPLDVVTI